MRAAYELIVDVAPGCHHKVGIRIYPTERALTKAFQSNDPAKLDGDAEAFCECENEPKERLATLCFFIGVMAPEVVAHEVFHAVAHLIKILRLNLDDQDAQELCAYAAGHLVEKTLHAKKLYERNSRH